MKIGVIIQARYCATRFPGKVLKELPFAGGITVLEQVIRRVKTCKNIDAVVLATTVNIKDASLVRIAKKEKIFSYRGDDADVLSRYFKAARKFGLDVIVRITSDCPCVDPKIISLLVKAFLASKADYLSNTLNRSFYHGADAEVFTFAALEKAHKNARRSFEREHVTPYVYLNPSLFKVEQYVDTSRLSDPLTRLTLDQPEDYSLLCAVYDYLYARNPFFGTKEIGSLFKKKPWLSLINKNVVHKTITRKYKP